MERPLINYRLLSDAVEYYASIGYEQVEVPWMVGPEACFATMPEDRPRWTAIGTDDLRYLIGSAEQGFLEMNLLPGRYMSVSPCFRRERKTPLHQETFMKVELYQTDDLSTDALDLMIEHSMKFFSSQTHNVVTKVPTDDGWDINVAGIEVGSYGYRCVDGAEWLYGTGLALPRFTTLQRV